MTPRLVVLASCGTALGCAVVGGALYAFSSFVMPALADLPPAHGVAAMQSINRFAVHGRFMLAFLASAAACAALAAVSLILRDAGWGLRIAGAAIYLGGVVALTAAYHVPRNTELTALPADAPASAAAWARYVADWTAWNHVRAAAGVAAAAALLGSAWAVRR
jgi:uncharacterized membrane protein